MVPNGQGGHLPVSDAKLQLALDTIAQRPTRGIPTMFVHLMDVPLLEEISGHPPGSYARRPEEVYLGFQRASGVCAIDQYIPDNPGTMSQHGFEAAAPHGATTGAQDIVCNGIRIDSPESLAQHLEQFAFPELERQIAACGPHADDKAVGHILHEERAIQARFGPDLLKIPYGGAFSTFPYLRYGQYGYEHYLTAYAVYPELMEHDFALQADLAERRNAIGARAIIEGGLPRVIRSDHDMADSRGTLVDVRSLDRLWFPHFARAIRPLVDAGIRMLWHCDGNLMAMVPRLIEAGATGFQGFQYEDGMDYEKICRMKGRNGEPLLIWAGVSVTRTLPFGTPQDVKDELAWLVRCGPKVGLFLGASSSITPGTNSGNVKTLIEGLRHYREHGRK